MNDDEIKALAFDWAIDYKPWQDDLHPNEYAEYGFEQGYRAAMRAMKHFVDNKLKDEE